jgi:hypothetical protein
MDNKNLTFGYIGAMAVALIAVFLPWVSISLNIPNMPSGMGSGSAAGFHCLQGVLTLLCALAGGGLCAIGPRRFIGANTKWVMTGIGGAIVILTVINFLVVHNSAETKDISALSGGSISISAGLGTWLALIAGIAGAALGWMIDWATAPILVNTGGGTGEPQGFPVVTTTTAAAPTAATPPVAPITPPPAEPTSSQTNA